MPDFRVEVGFVSHPKLKRLRRRIGDRAAEHLLSLWSFATLNRPSGDLSGMTNEEIADAAGCESDADGMLAALRDTKWIDGEDGYYQLHDWSEHQRWVIFAPKRRESARKAAEIRWHKKQVKQKVNAPRMRPACGGDAGSNAPSPSPDPNPSPIPKDQKPIVPRPGNGRFTIPTLDEVSEYCKARNNRVDPIKYHAHYTANGWRVGKNPMKNWKAAVVTWERSTN